MKTLFDKIYVVTLITNKNRQKAIKAQFEQLGLDFEFIYSLDYHNFQLITWPDVYKYTDDNFVRYSPRNYGCAIGHYQAVAQAYYLGFDNVLIFEDDVCLTKNIELLEYYLNNIPKDIGFINYDVRCNTQETYNYLENVLKTTHDEYIMLNKDCKMIGAAMYAFMNREIMKLYLDSQHQILVQSDWVYNFWSDPIIDRYIIKDCLFVDQWTYHYMLFNKMNEILSKFDTNLYLHIDYYDKMDFYKPFILNVQTRY